MIRGRMNHTLEMRLAIILMQRTPASFITSHFLKMAPSYTKKWTAELKAGFQKRIKDKQINPACTDPEYIEVEGNCEIGNK